MGPPPRPHPLIPPTLLPDCPSPPTITSLSHPTHHGPTQREPQTVRGGVPPARLPWAAESAPGRLLEATEEEEAGSRSSQGPTLRPTCHPIGPTQSGEHKEGVG